MKYIYKEFCCTSGAVWVFIVTVKMEALFQHLQNLHLKDSEFPLLKRFNDLLISNTFQLVTTNIDVKVINRYLKKHGNIINLDLNIVHKSLPLIGTIYKYV